ncbi:AAA family ATPase, partial [Escherichia coli]|nr:AAA family ATPase [Escherichia coli]
ILGYWISKYPNFAIVSNSFHLIDCFIGADNLKTIFNDSHLKETSLKSICILDGDHSPEDQRGIISLPGEKAPEQLIFEHCEHLYNTDDSSFWENQDIINNGFSKELYLLKIRPQLQSIETEIQKRKDN